MALQTAISTCTASECTILHKHANHECLRLAASGGGLEELPGEKMEMERPGALGNGELVAQVTPNQAGQAHQSASEQGEKAGFRNDSGSCDGRRRKTICSQS